MVFFITVRPGEMVRSKTTNQTNQRFQPVYGLHCSFITTGEPTVRLVSLVQSDRLKEQALNRRFRRHESRFLIIRIKLQTYG